jgi:hypothetical protein
MKESSHKKPKSSPYSKIRQKVLPEEDFEQVILEMDQAGAVSMDLQDYLQEKGLQIPEFFENPTQESIAALEKISKNFDRNNSSKDLMNTQLENPTENVEKKSMDQVLEFDSSDESDEDDNEDDPYSDTFFTHKETKQIGRVKLRTSFWEYNSKHYLHILVHNSAPYRSTRLCVPISDIPHITKIMKALLKQIKDTPKNELIPQLLKAGKYGLLQKKHKKFWKKEICEKTPSGLLIRALKEPNRGYYNICLLQPKSNYSFPLWKGPAFKLNVSHSKKFVKILERMFLELQTKGNDVTESITDNQGQLLS